MRTQNSIGSFLALGAAFLLLTGCGGKAVAVGDLPAFPGATELKAGDSRIGDTLAKNMEQDAAMRKAMGTGGQTEQRGFGLPVDATWDKVKGFYEKELKDRGWASGLGGIAGGMVDINSIMNTANQGNGLFQTMLWSRGSQNLSLIMTVSPTKAGEKTLILSLSTR